MQVYLTRISLNPRSNQVRSEIGNPQELHKTISRAFPPIDNPSHIPQHARKTPRNTYNILHRLDIDRKRVTANLLVQSAYKPDWSFLSADYADELKCKEIGENLEAIQNGMRLSFRLQANPTKRIGKSDPIASDKFKPDGSKANRRRVDIRDEQGQTEWLERQGLRCGFEIDRLSIDDSIRNLESVGKGKIVFRKNDKNASHSRRVTYGSVVFEGILIVTNASDFVAALQSGIGQGKAYGFGLLSIAPAREGLEV